jgi:hypothetical protein
VWLFTVVDYISRIEAKCDFLKFAEPDVNIYLGEYLFIYTLLLLVFKILIASANAPTIFLLQKGVDVVLLRTPLSMSACPPPGFEFQTHLNIKLLNQTT